MFDSCFVLLQGYLTDSGVVALERVQLIMQGKKHYCNITVKFLNFRTPSYFTVNILEFKQRVSPIHGMITPYDSNGIANSEKP